MKYFIWTTAAAALLLGGCGAIGTREAFGPDGLPQPKYYVGGGYDVTYTAPVRGTLYVVEENSRNLLITESLYPGQPFNLRLDLLEERIRRELRAVGADPDNARLSLYFVPQKARGGKENP